MKISLYATQQSAMRLGFWSAVLLALVAAAAFALGITTIPAPARIAPEPASHIHFTDAAQFVPRDYVWMLPGILLIPVFVIVAGCIHSLVEASKRHLSVIALCFASMAAGIIGINYFIQFQVAEPSLRHGETTGLALFTQYNPHGIFIALEDLGYLTLCIAFFFVGVALPRITRLAAANSLDLGCGRSAGVRHFCRNGVAFRAFLWSTGLKLQSSRLRGSLCSLRE